MQEKSHKSNIFIKKNLEFPIFLLTLQLLTNSEISVA